MINQDLYLANLAFLEKNFPAVHGRVAGLAQTVAALVVEDGEIVDINLGPGRLYKDDGRRMAEQQVAVFEAAPRRIGYKGVEGITSDSIMSRKFYDQMLAAVDDVGAAKLKFFPQGRANFLFVFGVGLGFHLPLLARQMDVQHIVVLEAVDEFMALSLRALDWQALVDEMAERNQTLHLLLGAEPMVMAEAINQIVQRQGEMLLDGAYFFRHYPHWPLDETFQRVLDDVPTKLVGRGYYEDERKMVRHAVVNLHKQGHYLIRGRFRRRYDVPAFIVAAGPSLDESIEYIRQWQDHAIIFSAGTTLQPLLRAGIIPDYHVELENIATLHGIMMHILAERPDLYPDGRFTGMKLIASVTVSPMVPPLFDEHYFFFRDSATSTACYGEGIEIMNGVGPSISNTCVAVAARLGFETMYLFGTDCGWRDASNHHSKATMYYTMTDYKDQAFGGEYSCPGNFGGTIHSNLIFTWTRDMIEQKVRVFDLKLFNCSDGAYIRGTTPLLPESLFLPGKPLDKEAVFKRIREESDYFGPGEFLKNHDMARYVPEVERLREDFLSLLDEIQAEGLEFRDMAVRITDFDREGYVGPYRHVYPLFQGSIIGFLKAATFYINRLPEAERRQLLPRFIDIYRELHKEMFDEGQEMYAASRIMVEGGPEPEWADGKPRVPGTTY